MEVCVWASSGDRYGRGFLPLDFIWLCLRARADQPIKAAQQLGRTAAAGGVSVCSFGIISPSARPHIALAASPKPPAICCPLDRWMLGSARSLQLIMLWQIISPTQKKTISHKLVTRSLHPSVYVMLQPAARFYWAFYIDALCLCSI